MKGESAMKNSIGKKPSRPGRAGVPRRLVVVKSLDSYIREAGRYGLLEGPIGKQRLSKDIKPLVEALHKVLAGATVSSVKIAGRYETSVAQRLDLLLRKAIAEANRCNAKKSATLMYI
jgi:hypothetical protein